MTKTTLERIIKALTENGYDRTTLNEVRDAIEARVPMVPEYISDTRARCPVCGHYLNYDINGADLDPNFCEMCGQALSWEAIEDDGWEDEPYEMARDLALEVDG